MQRYEDSTLAIYSRWPLCRRSFMSCKLRPHSQRPAGMCRHVQQKPRHQAFTLRSPKLWVLLNMLPFKRS